MPTTRINNTRKGGTGHEWAKGLAETAAAQKVKLNAVCQTAEPIGCQRTTNIEGAPKKAENQLVATLGLAINIHNLPAKGESGSGSGDVRAVPSIFLLLAFPFKRLLSWHLPYYLLLFVVVPCHPPNTHTGPKHMHTSFRGSLFPLLAWGEQRETIDKCARRRRKRKTGCRRIPPCEHGNSPARPLCNCVAAIVPVTRRQQQQH